MGRLFSSGVLVLAFLTSGCATTPYSVGAAPDRTGLAHYQSGRPTLISRAKTGVVEITPVASEFEDRIVLAVTAINIGVAPANFGYENVGAVYEDGGRANLVPVQALQREARERARIGRAAPGGAVSATSYGVDATAIVDSYGRPAASEALGLLRTTTIAPRNMVTGLIVLEKPWLNDRIRTLAINVEFGGEGHAFRLAIARRGVLLPLGGVAAAARYDTAEGLKTTPFIRPLPQQASLPVQPALKNPVQVARLKTPAAKTASLTKVRAPQTGTQVSRQPVRFDPYARPQAPRGVIE